MSTVVPTKLEASITWLGGTKTAPTAAEAPPDALIKASAHDRRARPPRTHDRDDEKLHRRRAASRPVPVSYTHLTLPTICSV